MRKPNYIGAEKLDSFRQLTKFNLFSVMVTMISKPFAALWQNYQSFCGTFKLGFFAFFADFICVVQCRNENMGTLARKPGRPKAQFRILLMSHLPQSLRIPLTRHETFNFSMKTNVTILTFLKY